MRAVIRIFLPVIDVLLSPFVAAGGQLFLLIRKAGIRNMRLSRSIFMKGDVLIEYLEILPELKPGVLVHIHDIFTPRDYPEKWLIDEVKLWNEQYVLEAFLSLNNGYRVIGALNFLRNHFFGELALSCPMLRQEPERNPGSFWIIRN